jgi:hypothetical protein
MNAIAFDAAVTAAIAVEIGSINSPLFLGDRQLSQALNRQPFGRTDPAAVVQNKGNDLCLRKPVFDCRYLPRHKRTGQILSFFVKLKDYQKQKRSLDQIDKRISDHYSGFGFAALISATCVCQASKPFSVIYSSWLMVDP